jgi:parvulin-like peptidyl-prolyl isomerase
MEKAIFSLPVGKISGIVKTPYGYHIFKVLERRPAGSKNLQEAMGEIESTLKLQKRTAFYRKWINELETRFPVTINQELLKAMEIS